MTIKMIFEGCEVCDEDATLDEHYEDQKGVVNFGVLDGYYVNCDDQKRHQCEGEHSTPVCQRRHNRVVQTYTVYRTSWGEKADV